MFSASAAAEAASFISIRTPLLVPVVVVEVFIASSSFSATAPSLIILS